MALAIYHVNTEEIKERTCITLFNLGKRSNYYVAVLVGVNYKCKGALELKGES